MKRLCTIVLCLILTAAFLLPAHRANAASLTGAGKVTTVSGALNVRKSASSSAAVLARLAKGSYVTLIQKSGSFWYVRYSAGFGYCSAAFLTTVSTNVKTTTAQSGLRVRSSASASGAVLNYLSYGTAVTVLSVSGSWSKVLYNGSSTGFVSSAYLTSGVTGSISSAYRSISLSVPDFKQTDSRWSSVTVGSSGLTIGKIGCATTALSMTESYRTGTTIYPGAMSKKLTYSAGGAVYWPSNYTIVTDQSGYFTRIYDLLKAGKPVIIGAKNAYGGQHYVVIKGVSACSSLSAGVFLINDPGSSSRTTLSQFFAVYPNFYKMLYY